MTDAPRPRVYEEPETSQTQETGPSTKSYLTWDYLKNWAYPLILTGLGFTLGGLFFYQMGVEAGKKQEIQEPQQLQETSTHDNPLLKQSRLETPEE
ncbi:hypothetical protein GF386_01130 [Candidatus Pacearchaeota archaeon]|nr:hypothetical protein [Candidatus Pacearchaeota archaeon]MBD3282834.1 hypothetical protein [Candidatus Pacearchaeota archaeon]